MSKLKKEIRRKFRESVFKRDGYKCVTCGFRPEDVNKLDAHHITDRNEMPNGGYVIENGISLCEPCHTKAESEHQGVAPPEGFSREELYTKIQSSYDLALERSAQSGD